MAAPAAAVVAQVPVLALPRVVPAVPALPRVLRVDLAQSLPVLLDLALPRVVPAVLAQPKAVLVVALA